MQAVAELGGERKAATAVRNEAYTIERAWDARGVAPSLPNRQNQTALKRPWSDGTTALELSAEDLAERLVALVPPLRTNQGLDDGVLASRHRWHRAVRPRPPKRRVAPAGVWMRLKKAGIGNSRWTPWSLLLWRVFGVVGMACPACGKVMVLRAEVRPPATLSVLASLERSERGPPSGAESDART